jgi:hypothetical protein
MKRQNSKDKKRKKTFHRGRGQARRFLKAVEIFGEPVEGVDYTLSTPLPMRRNGQVRKGDKLS